MASKKTKKSASKKDKGVIRSVRYTREQFAGIQKKADALGLEVSSFIRQASLRAAGLGNGEVKAAERVVKALKSLGPN